jgi:hypothetical protein
MESKKFTEAKLNLSKAAEIAIESLKKILPKSWDNFYFNPQSLGYVPRSIARNFIPCPKSE